MKLLKDLGLLKYGSKGKRMTYGVYECPICHTGFKCATSRIKKGIIAQCRSCADKSKVQKARVEFELKANKTHNHMYDYSLVNYTNAITKIEIVCPVHGVFWQTPHNHLKGTSCPYCKREETSLSLSKQAMTEFAGKASKLHKDKYNYSLVDYINNCTDVEIICPMHGKFKQKPTNHLHGAGCPSCAITGFDKSKPAILYYLKINGGQFYKIGITNKTVHERFTNSELQLIEIVNTWYYKNGAEAYKAEQNILKYFKEYKYVGIDILKSGNTELFIKDVLLLCFDISLDNKFFINVHV